MARFATIAGTAISVAFSVSAEGSERWTVLSDEDYLKIQQVELGISIPRVVECPKVLELLKLPLSCHIDGSTGTWVGISKLEDARIDLSGWLSTLEVTEGWVSAPPNFWSPLSLEFTATKLWRWDWYSDNGAVCMYGPTPNRDDPLHFAEAACLWTMTGQDGSATALLVRFIDQGVLRNIFSDRVASEETTFLATVRFAADRFWLMF